jgi:hypothetical protein
MCECHQIGGPFIAEDPNCPVHGRDAQEREEHTATVKRFWVLRWDQYYPGSGLNNVHSWHDTATVAEEVRQRLVKAGADWTAVVDMHEWQPGYSVNAKDTFPS